MNQSLWLKKRSNDEARPSSGQRPSQRPLPPPPPRAQDFVEPQATSDRRRYVPLLEFLGRWAEGQGCDNRAVSLHAGWHLNPSNVSVPLPPQEGSALQEEMHRRISNLPTRQRVDLAYHREDFWREFLAWEHRERRECTYRGDFSPAVEYKVLPSATSPPPSPYLSSFNNESTHEDAVSPSVWAYRDEWKRQMSELFYQEERARKIKRED